MASKLLGRINRPTKKDQEVSASFAVLGKIKIGEKTEKGYPTSLDYFKIGDSVPEEYRKMFQEAFGDRPNKLRIIFLSNDKSHVCRERMELRNDQGKLAAVSDGKNFEIVDENGNWQFYDEKSIIDTFDCPDVKQFAQHLVDQCGSKQGWKAVLHLRFALPDLPLLGGEWVLETKGTKTSINQIVSVFDQTLETGKSVTMLPFDLIVEMVKSQRINTNRRYPVLKLVLNISQNAIENLAASIDAGVNIRDIGLLDEGKIRLLNTERTDGHEIS